MLLQNLSIFVEILLWMSLEAFFFDLNGRFCKSLYGIHFYIVKYLMYSFHRPHVEQLVEFISSSSDMRVIAIIGPRQVGKTIIAMQGLDQLIKSGFTCKYISFDDPHTNPSDWSKDTNIVDVLTVNQLANPQTLVSIWESARKASLESPKGHVLFLDEVQLIPEWSNYVKGL